MTEEQVKNLRCSLLLLSLDESRKKGFLCDFTVKVGEKSFPAHRLVLANSSGYFKSLFETKLKEYQDGIIDMEEVDSDAIELCISSMYTGKADITMNAVQHILHASNLLQLDDLKNLCVNKMQRNLTPQNCLFVIELARLYDRFELIRHAEKFLASNFDAVVSSEYFSSISKSELLHYTKISNGDCQTTWRAAVEWSKEQNDALANFTELTSTMSVGSFPIKFLLETVLEEPLVNKSEKIKTSVIKTIFGDVRKVREHIEVENCFNLKKQSETHEIPNSSKVKEMIYNFLERNFEEIVKERKFCEISKFDVMKLLKSTKVQCPDETVKYDAVLKWIKHDVKNRKKVFSELFCLIKLRNLSENFLKETVRNESFVTDSRKCNGVLLDEIFSRLDKTTSSETTQQAVPDSQEHSSAENVEDNKQVFINEQPKGKMSRRIINDFLPGCKERTNEITYLFKGGTIQGVHYFSVEFTAYLPNTHEYWKLVNLLVRAFDAGLTFKLQVLGNNMGKIVWNDIPHKTCKDGGPPNGYPDFGYLDRLKHALQLKGLE